MEVGHARCRCAVAVEQRAVVWARVLLQAGVCARRHRPRVELGGLGEVAAPEERVHVGHLAARAGQFAHGVVVEVVVAHDVQRRIEAQRVDLGQHHAFLGRAVVRPLGAHLVRQARRMLVVQRVICTWRSVCTDRVSLSLLPLLAAAAADAVNANKATINIAVT